MSSLKISLCSLISSRMTLKILAPVVTLLLINNSIWKVSGQGLLEEYAGWTHLEFENDTAPSYVPENAIITGIQVSKSHIFLTIPRLRPDVPATLAVLPRKDGPSESPKLQPYPSWAWQHGHHDQCASLVSVFRSRLDPCGRLWVLDTGSVNALADFEQLCPPKLVVFNADGSESFRVEVPQEVLQPDSMLVALALDRRGPERLQSCPQMNETVVYISDVISGIIVFDLACQTFWRHEHQSMSPDPAHASITIKDESFYLEDGVLGMAVGVHQKSKVLFYQPLASKSIYAMQASSLMDPYAENLNVMSVLRKESQSAGLIADGMSRLFFSQMTQTDVKEWTPQLSRLRTIANDPERLQFVSDFAIDQQGTLWMVSNKFHKYFNENFSNNSTNMRVLRIPRGANKLYVST